MNPVFAVWTFHDWIVSFEVIAKAGLAVGGEARLVYNFFILHSSHIVQILILSLYFMVLLIITISFVDDVLFFVAL
jgi:hypothetical protein